MPGYGCHLTVRMVTVFSLGLYRRHCEPSTMRCPQLPQNACQTLRAGSHCKKNGDNVFTAVSKPWSRNRGIGEWRSQSKGGGLGFRVSGFSAVVAVCFSCFGVVRMLDQKHRIDDPWKLAKLCQNHIFPSAACEATTMTKTPKMFFFHNFDTLFTTTDQLMDI